MQGVEVLALSGRPADINFDLPIPVPKAEMESWIVAGTVTLIRLDLLDLSLVIRAQLKDRIVNTGTVFIDDLESYPMAAVGVILEQPCAMVFIHDHDV